MQFVRVRGVAQRVGLTLATLAILGMTAWAALVPVGAASAQEGAVAPIKLGSGDSAEVAQPWTVNCTSDAQTGELRCTMTQALIAKETNQRLVAITVLRPAPAAAALLRISLPHGIQLQKGVDLWVNEGARTNVPITIADQNGSYADLELGTNVLASLQGGNTLNLGVVSGAGEAIELTLSLKGFTAAFAKI